MLSCKTDAMLYGMLATRIAPRRRLSSGSSEHALCVDFTRCPFNSRRVAMSKAYLPFVSSETMKIAISMMSYNIAPDGVDL